MRKTTVKKLRVIVLNKWMSLSTDLKKINPFKSFFRRAKEAYLQGRLAI